MKPAPMIATSVLGLIGTGFLDVGVNLHNRARPGHKVVRRHFCALGQVRYLSLASEEFAPQRALRVGKLPSRV